MKIMKKLLSAVLTAGMIFSLSGMTAAAAKEYTYTVTFDAGNQGSFSGMSGLEVESTTASVNLEGGRIVVRGLRVNDVISFNAQAGAVSMNDDSKYYVKGFRQSGRDTEELSPSSFRVTEDADYVIAYGIKGNLVGYTVNYQDAEGNELAPSQTFYGNVGDKPVIAHIYVEGYTPEALALTKTLSANESENVFTFVYNEGETQVIVTPGETVTDTVIEYVDGTTGETGTRAPEGTGTEGTGTATQAPDEDAEAGEDAGEIGTDEQDTTEVEDEEVPEDLVDLDDEEAPLANVDLDKKDVEKGLPLAAGIAIAAAAVAALVGLIIFLRKHHTGKND